MSADNAIVVGKFLVNGKKAFSVVHFNAMDNLEYYRDQGDSQELQEFVHGVWNQGKFFLDEKEAWAYAQGEDRLCPTEYGLMVMDFSNISPMPNLVAFSRASE